MDGWLNIYKPRGISSARLVSVVKKALKGAKVGHCGTLDLEAEGILPLAIGEATKLTSFLVDARKTYIFTVKFGSKTDTADAAGKVIEITKNIPTEEQCQAACANFVGVIEQIPPAFSALKVDGVRSYKLARQGSKPNLTARNITIYRLEMLSFDETNSTATYIAECSKGTYIRTLGEDIALSLQSLCFVIRLARERVGSFDADSALKFDGLNYLSQEDIYKTLSANIIKIEAVLDDILVLDATTEQARKIKYGQKCLFDYDHDIQILWIRYCGALLAIGSLSNNCFVSYRVFNLISIS